MSTTSVLSDKSRLYIGAASLTFLTCLLAVIVWGQTNEWQLLRLSSYQIFPLLGLLAFSIMWAQYMLEAAKNLRPSLPSITKYFSYTSWAVLVLILLHPGLLIFQRFRDGYGLPPESYVTYVAPMQKWIVLLGSVSLLIFIAFEFKKFFIKHDVWHLVQILNDLAIIAIFYHGLKLGTQLHADWYQNVWYVYGVTLIAALGYKYYVKLQRRKDMI